MVEDSAKKQIKIAFRMYPVWKIDISQERERVCDNALVGNLGEGIKQGRTAPKSKAKTFDSKLADMMANHKYRWVSVVDSVIEFYEGTEKGKLLKMKYMSVYMPITLISMTLHISKAQLFNWESDIINKAYRLAIVQNLLPA